jgi:hypothetical protein
MKATQVVVVVSSEYCSLVWVLQEQYNSSYVAGHPRTLPIERIVDTPWYVPNAVIRRDLKAPTAKEEIRRHSSQCRARLRAHPNGLVVDLMEPPDNRRLRRHPPTRFLV